FVCVAHLRELHSFPTRRSSDLPAFWSTWAAACHRSLFDQQERARTARDYLVGLALCSGSFFCRLRERQLQKRADFLDCAHINLRSEEHTSELQSRSDLVCRLLL